MAEISDNVRERHIKLKTDIVAEIVTDSPEYNAFVESFKIAGIAKGILGNAKTLFDKLTLLETKGKLAPGKYDMLISIAQTSGQQDLVELIKRADADIQSMRDDCSEDKPGPSSSNGTGTSKRAATDQPNHQEPKKARVSSQEADEEDPIWARDDNRRGYYDYKGKRGYLLIISYSNGRKAAKEDVLAVKTFFRDELNFDVDVNDEDLSLAELNEYLEAAKKRLNDVLGKNIYCFVCIMMGHGNEKGIATTDGQFKSPEQIRIEFRNHEIPNYTGRPKVFLIQSCRGEDRQDGVEIDEDDDEPKNQDSEAEIDEDDLVKVPHDADTLLAFSTTPGYKSFRKTSGTRFLGSWFIHFCVKVFKEFYKSDHLEDMLITVRERVAAEERPDDRRKQMPCVWSTLTRRLYLTKSTS